MLHFPEVEEIPLPRSPIAEVICQIRFPLVLRILTEQPVDFQKIFRSEFPHLEVQHGLALQFDPLSGSAPMVQNEPRVYQFKTRDKQTSISLAPDFFAVTTTKYQSWNSFVRVLRLATKAVIQVYEIDSIARIGLRYINHLTKANTSSEETIDVLDVLRPELTALWRGVPGQEPLQAVNHLLLEASEEGRLALRLGYRQDEPICVLDLDCYIESDSLLLADAEGYCEQFHNLIYSAFRWCIRDEKLRLFGAP